MSVSKTPRAGWLAVLVTICIWTGFILVSRAGGKGMLTGWDVTALRFGVGASIALFFLRRVTLPPLKVIALFSLFGGIGYATAVYAAFRMAPAAHASVFLPGALPFATALIAWLWLKQAPSRRQRIALTMRLADEIPSTPRSGPAPVSVKARQREERQPEPAGAMASAFAKLKR